MPITINSPQTDIEIINLAAILCGKNGINTVEVQDKFALNASFLYGSLVRAEFASNRWRFCLHSQEISNLTTLTTELDSWRFFWDLPADLLMLQRIDPRVRYTVFGSRLLTTSNGPLTVVYLRSVPVSEWPETFKYYIAHALASALALSATGSDRMVARLQADKIEWQVRAMFADGQSSPQRLIQSQPYKTVRN